MDVKTQKNIPYYLVAGGLFLLLKAGYTAADNSQLKFLLAPTSELVALITNAGGQFHESYGYFHEALRINIDKSCAGFNFWILCFVMLAFLGLGFWKTPLQKMLSLPLMLVGAYVLTIFANISRILLSVMLHSAGAGFLPSELPSWMHQAEGSFVYLSFLIAIYFAAEFLLKKQTPQHVELT